mmetsp:Transcript_38851/g.111060  ORF Transcript_38851/g.111060 Transcript_38851/m.111060 type:complete len:367 (+) Transcript_38851:660-1760(+)
MSVRILGRTGVEGSVAHGLRTTHCRKQDLLCATLLEPNGNERSPTHNTHHPSRPQIRPPFICLSRHIILPARDAVSVHMKPARNRVSLTIAWQHLVFDHVAAEEHECVHQRGDVDLLRLCQGTQLASMLCLPIGVEVDDKREKPVVALRCVQVPHIPRPTTWVSCQLNLRLAERAAILLIQRPVVCRCPLRDVGGSSTHVHGVEAPSNRLDLVCDLFESPQVKQVQRRLIEPHQLVATRTGILTPLGRSAHAGALEVASLMESLGLLPGLSTDVITHKMTATDDWQRGTWERSAGLLPLTIWVAEQGLQLAVVIQNIVENALQVLWFELSDGSCVEVLQQTEEHGLIHVLLHLGVCAGVPSVGFRV